MANQTPIEAEAIRIIKGEKTSWETAEAFVTDKVAFQMRNLIRNLRKNYWGIFDKDRDPLTGRKKIWIPLTESMVETVVKNIDLDTKDINFRAKKAESVGLTSLVRSMVKNELDEMFFGEILDQAERQLAIDGTMVWKTQEVKNGKRREVDIRQVDLLNFYIDPTARSIQETPAVIERAVLTKDEFMANEEWDNKELAVSDKNLNLYDGELGNISGNMTGSGETELVEVFERWGKMPKFLMNNKREDKDVMVDGRIVASGTNGKWVIHLIEETDGLKPYEEAWYTRVPGRWYGKGIAEKVMWLQLWQNTIANIRINRSYVSQLGIFKIKKGSGITAQMVSKLAANGAITVNNTDDIEQFVMQEASSASYKDEEVITGWAQRVTSAFEAVTGESLPASTSATAVAIQARGGQSQFVLIKEGIGMFLQRWIKRHFLPTVQKNIKVEDIIRLSDDDILVELDERIVNRLLAKKLVEINELGAIIDPVKVEQERQRALDKLQAMGKDRWVKLLKDINLTEFDVQVFITNEEIDKGVMAQNLTSILQIATQVPGLDAAAVIESIMDLMGLDSNRFKARGQLAPEGTQALPEPQGGQEAGTQDPVRQVTAANTLQGQ